MGGIPANMARAAEEMACFHTQMDPGGIVKKNETREKNENAELRCS